MEAVRSALAQNYRNIEVLLVKDGASLCEPYLGRLADCRRLTYVPLGSRQGRAAAGNEGLKRARGDYFNFLDDDDLLYPDHVETLVRALDGREAIAYAGWESVRTKWISFEPLKYRATTSHKHSLPPFNKFSLWIANFIAIQSVMFPRSFYDQLGGFDPALNALEDWELWCRYSTRGDFLFVPELTSLVRTMHDRAASRKKFREYEESFSMARQKIEALPFNLDRFDREAFVRFTEHFAPRNGYFTANRRIARILERLRLVKGRGLVGVVRRPPREL
jgi:glycosyltransferase involved in cell wall biosynthesis